MIPVPIWAQKEPVKIVPETRPIPLLEHPVDYFPLASAEHVFRCRLPEHVRFSKGSRLQLVLRAPKTPLQHLCKVTVLVNELELFSGQPSRLWRLEANEAVLPFSLAVPEKNLIPDWNRIVVRFTWEKPPGAGYGDLEGYVWSAHQSETRLEFQYERRALVPELRRFPFSLTEESLLRPSEEVDPEPVVALLLPPQRRDVHLQSVAVLGACLGKPGYPSPTRLGLIEEWSTESTQRNGLLVGRLDELRGLTFATNMQPHLEGLQGGEGFIGEMITGQPPRQHRWILLSGGDDAGLEKALLTLAHAPSLLSASPNPNLIQSTPLVTGPLEAEAQPGPVFLTIQDPRLQSFTFRGLYESERVFSDWHLPPGYRTTVNGSMDLHLSHAPELTASNSLLDVLLNGVKLETIPLTEDNATAGKALVRIPPGLPGYETMSVSFRARLDVPETSCDDADRAKIWLTISNASTLLSRPAPVRIENLAQVQAMLVQDLFLRKIAFLVPHDASLADLQWWMRLCMHLGRQLASASVLWPEACGYGPQSTPPVERLKNRSVLLLGSIGQWRQALDGSSEFPIKMEPDRPEDVILQGRRHAVRDFEPSLAFVSMTDSPWSPGEKLVAAGGFHSFALPSLERLLTNPDSPGKLSGSLAAMDVQGRTAIHQPGILGGQSLAEGLRRDVPPGLTVEETTLHQAKEASKRRQGTLLSYLFVGCLGAMGAVLAILRARRKRQD